MAEFSTTQRVCDPVLPCQRGNLFLNALPLEADSPVLMCTVNGNDTGPLPNGLMYRLPNSLEGTANSLTLSTGDRDFTLFEELDSFPRTRPEDVGVYIGPMEPMDAASPPPPGPSRTERALHLLRTYDMPRALTHRQEIETLQQRVDLGVADNDTHAALDSLLRQVEDTARELGYVDPPIGQEDIYVFALPNNFAIRFTEGEYDLDALSEQHLQKFVIAIAHGLQLIDEASGLQALTDGTDGAVDFTLRGTNLVPLALDLTNMLRRGENRAFIREVARLGGNGRISKVWRNANGTMMLSFRGQAGMRQFLTATAYGVGNAKVGIISTAVQNSQNWAGTLSSVGKGVPVISIVLIGAIDYAEWLAAPETESELSHLIGTLIVDISKVGISVMAGAIAAAGAVLFGWSLIVIVSAGIGAGIAVGFVLDTLDETWGVTRKVQELAKEVGLGLDVFLSRRESGEWSADPAVAGGGSS
ncbi:hypothetical protein EKK97_10255 [Billgrantia tianxiuensis]|uniref:Uncharacterized protein n=1 Tax=Billgrantia tianxiuensis TaxID=2497861 RepID=A0A6I6SQZ5_9GAMM|nr:MULTISPECIES: hypothetical protein [Halomonas]MCE8032045.1 hypothetical protein [Halomonas sp. MCCC 1A11057]QHC49915.1 hypothetical protein EKK97_10255 [Halomonas tianxiuensis]